MRVHVAQLEPKHYAAVLSGAKREEFRDRRRRDVQLDQLEAGDLILFRECRTERAMLVSCDRVRLEQPTRRHRVRYTILVSNPRPIELLPCRKVQGWHVRELTSTGARHSLRYRLV